jgi:hypothetical protein
VLTGIIVNIVECRVIVTLRADGPIAVAIPNTAPTCSVVLVPHIGGTTVDTPEGFTDILEILDIDEDMVVVGQNNPRSKLYSTSDEFLKEFIQEHLATLRSHHVVTVFEA